MSAKLATGPTSVINLITQRAFCTGNVIVEHVNGFLIPHMHAVALALLEGAAWTSEGEKLEPLDLILCGQGTKSIQFKEALTATITVFP